MGHRWKGLGTVTTAHLEKPLGSPGLLLPGDTNHKGWQLPGPLSGAVQVAGHKLTSSSPRKGECEAQLQPALPSIIPIYMGAFQTPMAST